MADSDPRIRATTLEGLETFLRVNLAMELEPLLVEVGISARPPWDKAPMLSLEKYTNLLEVIADRGREPCLGLSFARAYPRGAGGVLGFLILNAPDLRSFMLCLQRYSHIQVEALDLSFNESDGLLKITWDYRTSLVGPRKQLTEFVMALFVIRLTDIFGLDLKPLAAEFEYREPPCRDGYARLFGPNLRFDTGRNTLTTRADILSRRSHSSDERLYKLLESFAQTESEKFAQPQTIVAQIDQMIATRLSNASVELDDVATALNMKTRHLQTQLKNNGTSFEAEVNRIRTRLAERYLRETDLAMTDIALLLGFSELSSFTRAAGKWFGMPPSAFRTQSRTS